MTKPITFPKQNPSLFQNKTHHFSKTKPITFPKQNPNQIIYFIRMAKQNKSIIAQWVKSDIYYIKKKNLKQFLTLKNTICGKNNICFEKTSNFITKLRKLFNNSNFFHLQKIPLSPNKINDKDII